jgi:hypothetical protein
VYLLRFYTFETNICIIYMTKSLHTLSDNDYISILQYYNLSIPKSKRLLKIKAEKIMAQKLCKCIKKLGTNNEPKSIGICTKTIFNRKGYRRSSFQCKKKQTVKFGKYNKGKSNATRKLTSR